MVNLSNYFQCKVCIFNCHLVHNLNIYGIYRKIWNHHIVCSFLVNILSIVLFYFIHNYYRSLYIRNLLLNFSHLNRERSLIHKIGKNLHLMSIVIIQLLYSLHIRQKCHSLDKNLVFYQNNYNIGCKLSSSFWCDIHSNHSHSICSFNNGYLGLEYFHSLIHIRCIVCPFIHCNYQIYHNNIKQFYNHQDHNLLIFLSNQIIESFQLHMPILFSFFPSLMDCHTMSLIYSYIIANIIASRVWDFPVNPAGMKWRIIPRDFAVPFISSLLWALYRSSTRWISSSPS